MSDHFYIAGASSRAQTARAYIEYLNADQKLSAYLVSPEMTDNPSEMDGVKVLPITEIIAENLDTTASVYLGTRGVNHSKLETELRAIGFTDIIPVDMKLDMELRNAYLERYYREQGRELVRMDMLHNQDFLYSNSPKARDRIADDVELHADRGQNISTGIIYVASSMYDGKLQDVYQPLPEEAGLQVGAALTDNRLKDCKYYDDEGDNISRLNRQFCELTGLYWVWKHGEADYIGLVHYRRHFLLPDDWIRICDRYQIDVILPVPLYVAPSVAENYKNRHEAADWEYLESYIREQTIEEYEDFKRTMYGNLYSPCNMLIARREVLNELCSWLFPILFRMAEHGGTKDDSYQNRYPGFLSERLITYFFERRRERYNIVYCNKNFLN